MEFQSVKEIVAKCLHNPTIDVNFKLFFSNEEKVKNVWNEVGKGFWFKFIVSIREIAAQKTEYRPFEYDKIFINILKKISMKSFLMISELMNNLSCLTGCALFLPDLEAFIEGKTAPREKTEKAIRAIFGEHDDMEKMFRSQMLQCYELHILWAGTFLNACFQLAAIKISDDMSWEIPFSWYYPASHLFPFEQYIKEKWDTTISPYKNEIGWWNAIVKGTKPLPAGLDMPSNFSPNMGWMPQKRSRGSPRTNATFIEEAGPHTQLQWNILIFAFPPLMARRFHIANAEELNASNSHQMALGAWFVLWQEAFGDGLLDNVNHLHCKLLAAAHHQYQMGKFEAAGIPKTVTNWAVKMQQMIDVIGVMRDLPAAPRQPGDSVERSAEFLLEPCILMQLPWNHVIQHQWLSAAVIEVLKFELETIELRHWPLPEEAEECARELVSLVRQAKESILLGLYLFHRQATYFPNTFNKIPAKMMDKVVLPLTAIFELFCSGKAYAIVKALRSFAFTHSYPLKKADLNKLSWMPDAAYLPHSELLKFYTKVFWHVKQWQNMLTDEPFPSDPLRASVTETWNNEVTPRATNLTQFVKKLSVEEKIVLDFCLEKDKEGKSELEIATTMIDDTVNAVQLLITKGYLPKSTEKNLITFFRSDPVKMEAVEVVREKDTTQSNVKLALQSSFIIKRLSNTLKGIEKADAVQSWMVRLCGEVLERDQYSRLALVCGLQVEQTPVLAGAKSDVKMDMPSLLAMLKDTRAKIGLRSREWLWQQLPASWLHPVTVSKQAPSVLKETPLESKAHAPTFSQAVQQAVAALESRLGSILAGVARESFQVWESGRVAFSQWPMLQYMMPGHLSSLSAATKISDTESNRVRVQNLIKLLHTMLASYEEQYLFWLSAGEYREDVLPKLNYNEHKELFSSLSVNHNRFVYLMGRVQQLMNAFIGIGRNLEGMPGYPARTSSLIQFQLEYVPDIKWGKCTLFEKFVTDAWKNTAYYYLNQMLQFCQEAWKPPVPGTALSHTHLGELYLANAAIEKLVLVMAEILLPTMDPKRPAKQMDEMCFVCPCTGPDLQKWRCEMLVYVAEVAGLMPREHCKTGDDNLNKFTSKVQEVLNKQWSLFCRSMQRIGKFPQDIEVSSTDPPQFNKIMELFKQGKMNILGEMLKLKTPEASKAKAVRSKGKRSHKPPMKPLVSESCRVCKKQEVRSGTFIKCPECVKEKYPDVNYFCSKKCQDHWWQVEHMAEHLEYSLGLSHLCINK